MNKRQVALIVLDGWGYREEKKNNAINETSKPNFEKLWNKFPHTTLEASGESIGLPKGQIGTSEIGHMTIGAGTILDSELVKINKSIKSEEFEKFPVFVELFNHVKRNNSFLHVIGLVSPGGVHSHMNHLFRFLEVAKNAGITKIVIHAITDGRDTPPQAGSGYLKELENFLDKLGVGEIASVSGRLYAMERDKRWERLQLVTEAIFEGKGPLCKIKPSEYVKNLYKQKEKESDEYLIPFVCQNREEKIYTLNKKDGIFLFNFRADRMRMLTEKLIEKRKKENLFLVTMIEYGEEYKAKVVFPKVFAKTCLGKIISKNGLTQAHIAETEKFAHATYFLNCEEEKPFKGEEQILIQSPKGVLTYDLAPKMSAEEVANETIRQIEKGTNFVFTNFANADMVGHTANVSAIKIAIEEVDKQLGRVIEVLHKKNGIALITADHGNAEINIDEKTGERHTAHTTSLVPLIITNIKGELKNNGGLSDIAPIILNLFEIKKPKEMTGESLIIKFKK